MNQQEIENWIEDAFKDGYSIEEIHDALREEGVEEQKIRVAVRDLRRKLEGESSSSQEKDVIGGIDLSDNVYKVRQNFILNRYKVWDDEGEMVLRAKQKMFRLKEKIPFYDSDGNVVFRVHGNKIIDIAGDYSIIDEESGENIAVLKKNYTIFTHHWKIKSGDSSEKLLATVESQSKILAALRTLGGYAPVIPNIFSLIPHKYVIENPDGEDIGHIKGKFSIRDAYKIEIDDPENIPKESLVASAIAIDALEGN